MNEYGYRKVVNLALEYFPPWQEDIGDFSQPAHYYELDIPKLLPPPKNMTNCNLEGYSTTH